MGTGDVPPADRCRCRQGGRQGRACRGAHQRAADGVSRPAVYGQDRGTAEVGKSAGREEVNRYEKRAAVSRPLYF